MILTRRFHLRNVVGNRGENDATRYLRSIGFEIVERNYRNNRGKALGEIDIIAKEQGQIVFVEVKTRTSLVGREVLPEAGITSVKLRKLERIAAAYLRERRCESIAYRFDAVLVVYNRVTTEPQIRHFRGMYL